jgi:hypothetical protein
MFSRDNNFGDYNINAFYCNRFFILTKMLLQKIKPAAIATVWRHQNLWAQTVHRKNYVLKELS